MRFPSTPQKNILFYGEAIFLQGTKIMCAIYIILEFGSFNSPIFICYSKSILAKLVV
jgi:hypothetical protein